MNLSDPISAVKRIFESLCFILHDYCHLDELLTIKYYKIIRSYRPRKEIPESIAFHNNGNYGHESEQFFTSNRRPV
jgi:hypothetical protein